MPPVGSGREVDELEEDKVFWEPCDEGFGRRTWWWATVAPQAAADTLRASREALNGRILGMAGGL
ncbi:MAG: hypothetical protein ACRD0E_12215, partial [Acidimicrobiales bacterium]